MRFLALTMKWPIRARISELPEPEAVYEYLNDTEVNWGNLKEVRFCLQNVFIDDMQYAQIRPLDLDELDFAMATLSRTEGPIVLDADLSVIDGMHRLADAHYSGQRYIRAYVRC